IGDSGYNVARILQRKNVYSSKFNPEMITKIDRMLDLLDNAFSHMITNLELGYTQIENINSAEDAENSINEYRNHLKEEHLLNLEHNIYNYQTGVFYMDLIAECEKVGDYIINVSEAIIDIK
ncbi:MAG: Na/Pi cotransporter family protein, partial [Bacteroidales bacterium]